MIAQASTMLNATMIITIIAGVATLSACSSVSTVTSSDGPCLDDSKGCIESRTAMVATLVADPNRSWVGQNVDRRMAASGIRLFAYQNVMDSLDCPKLLAGVRELQSARAVLGTAPIAGQTAERHNQIRALTADTEASMAAKAKRRGCKAA